MLNDFFITRDVIGFIQNYLDSLETDNDEGFAPYRHKLEAYSQKQHMSYEQWWDLLQELNTLLNVPALGVEIGKHVKVEHCGVLGYLFRTSRDMTEALTCFQRFERLLYAGSTVTTEQNEPGCLSVVWDPQYGYSSQLSDELLLASMASITREIIRPYRFNPAKVAFTQAIESRHIAIYETFFGCEVLQGQERLTISFRLQDLVQPIPHKDQTLNSLLGKQAEELLQHLPDNDLFLVELRDAVIRCLHEGRPDTQRVADQLGISVRTLHRRLKDKNRVFRDILKDIRKSMAKRYLSDDRLTLAEVSLLLGYGEQSAFTRAFSSWFGETPLQYKRSITRAS